MKPKNPKHESPVNSAETNTKPATNAQNADKPADETTVDPRVVMVEQINRNQLDIQDLKMGVGEILEWIRHVSQPADNPPHQQNPAGAPNNPMTAGPTSLRPQIDPQTAQLLMGLLSAIGGSGGGEGDRIIREKVLTGLDLQNQYIGSGLRLNETIITMLMQGKLKLGQ